MIKRSHDLINAGLSTLPVIIELMRLTLDNRRQNYRLRKLL